MTTKEIKVAKDFTTAPGPRYRTEGKFSGEQFRTEVLLPHIFHACHNGSKLVIDLDGVSGYGCAFLEEAFGGLVRVEGYNIGVLSDLLVFKSTEEPELIDEIKEYILQAELQGVSNA